jgi:hypothetical protein
MTQDDPIQREIDSKLSELSSHRETLPRGLEDQVVAHLHQEGLLARAPVSWEWRALAACAAVGLFLIGLWIGRATSKPIAPEYNYVLLLQEGAAFHGASTAVETEHRVGEYRQWALDLRSKGIAISGLKLQETAWPLSSTADFLDLAGIFMVKANDEAEARRIAETCPHLHYGGGIVIKPIAKT